MAVERRGVGVEVIGVPDFMSDEQTVDKLLIHFLRPRNGGGEVQRVLYPLHLKPGHAVIIYEEPNVAARVLQKRHHELEVGDQTFHVEVKPVDRPELDHPVEATLNFNTIADITELERLLHLYGLEVIHCDRRNGQARVKGSMMMLRPFMAEIQKLLKAQTPKLTRPSSSSSPSSPLGSPSPPAADSKNSTRGSSARAKQNPSWSTAAPPYASPSPSLSPTSFSTSFSSWPAVDPVDRRRPTPKPEESPFESFVTSSEGLQYAQSYKKLGIQDVLAEHNAQMDVTAVTAHVSRVVVTGWRPRDAAAELQRLLSDVGAALHVRQVPLGGLDHDARVGVAKRIQELKPDFPMVLILQKGDGVHLVGPRLDCEQLKDGVLQERPAEWQERPAKGQERPAEWQERPAKGQERPAESQLQARTGRSRGKGRGDERAKEVKRRSRSLPRMQASLPGEAAGDGDPTAASLNGGPSWPRAGQEGGRGAPPTYVEENYGGPETPNLRPAKSPALLPSLLPVSIQKILKRNKLSVL